MSTTVINKNSIKYKFKDLDFISNYAIFFSARKGLKTKIFYDFAETIKMPEKILHQLLICLQEQLVIIRKEEKP